MNVPIVAGVIFGLIMFGSVFGMILSQKIPPHYAAVNSKDAIRQVMALLITMVALVLGLMIGSAKSLYDSQRSQIVGLSVAAIQLDRILSRYGPEADQARLQFRDTLELFMDRIWPADLTRSTKLELELSNHAKVSRERASATEDFYMQISKLEPQTSIQRLARARALDISADIGRREVTIYAQSGSSIPLPFVVVLAFWIGILSIGFGLFAPTNALVLAAFFVGALSVAAAVSLILQLDQPYSGLMQLSPAPLRGALAEIDR